MLQTHAAQNPTDAFFGLMLRATAEPWSKKQLSEKLRLWGSKFNFKSLKKSDIQEMPVRIIDYFEPYSMEQSGRDIEYAVPIRKLKMRERVLPTLRHTGHAMAHLLVTASLVAMMGAILESPITTVGHGLFATGVIGFWMYHIGREGYTSAKRAFFNAAETHYAVVLREGLNRRQSLALGRIRVPKTAVSPVKYPNP